MPLPNSGGTQATITASLECESGNANIPGFGSSDQLDIILFNPRIIDNQGDWAMSQVLAHEIGHNLNLKHTYDGCSFGYYLADIFGSPNNCPHIRNWSLPSTDSPNDKITNNVMGGNRDAGYFSPLQIGLIHQSLALTNARQYLVDCVYDQVNPWYVTNNELWDFDLQFEKDIILNNNSILEVDCKLSMPSSSKIIVNSGSTLIVNGIITNNCDNGWDGTIEVKPGGILRLSADAEITLKGNGKILIEDDATNPGKLIFEQGAEVYLDDFTTSIEINGNLEIANNATFEFKHHSSHHGYVKFGNTSQFPSRNITAGSSASINLVGSSTNRTILEIDQETFYAPAGLVNFNISGGKVVFNAGSRLQADGSATNISFDNVRFTSNTPGVNNGHRGVHLYGQPYI